jgi:hypothetical protein
MKIVSFDRLSVLNLHYYQYSLDYFLDRMCDLGVKNVELLGGHQGTWLDSETFENPMIIRKKLEERKLCCPVFTPQNCRFGYQFAVKEPALRKKTLGFLPTGYAWRLESVRNIWNVILGGAIGMSRWKKDKNVQLKCYGVSLKREGNVV